MRISDWSSDVCSSDLGLEVGTRTVLDVLINQQNLFNARQAYAIAKCNYLQNRLLLDQSAGSLDIDDVQDVNRLLTVDANAQLSEERSEEHTSELQSLVRISYAVFCLKKKKQLKTVHCKYAHLAKHIALRRYKTNK